jgi:hypothetical protein
MVTDIQNIEPGMKLMTMTNIILRFEKDPLKKQKILYFNLSSPDELHNYGCPRMAV